MDLAKLGALTAQLGPVERLFFRTPAASDSSGSVDSLFMFIFWLSVFFFTLLMGLMVYFCVRYRRRPGVPSQLTVQHNTPLELTWSIVPLLLLVVMFLWGFTDFINARVAPGESEAYTLRAQKWNWSIEYPTGKLSTDRKRVGATDVPVFYVSEDRPVQMRMISSDVVHSFWVPDFRVKRDVFPNRYTSYWFKPHAIGPDAETLSIQGVDREFAYEDHYIFCAEYCGDQHSEMAAILRVVPDDVYEQWVNQVVGADWPKWKVGQYLYTTKGCVACHKVDGTRLVGPPWDKTWMQPHTFADGSTLDPSDGEDAYANYIRQSILEPSAKIVSGFPNQMQSYQGQIKEKEIDAIIAYMQYLKEGEPGGAPGETGSDTGGGGG